LTTPKLALPELVVGQAGKELTHNQALAVLDQLAQAVVVDKDLATPPVSPANGAMYIVAAGATGAWSGQSGKLAYWLTSVGAWTFSTPVNGWSVWVADEAVRYELKAGVWTVVATGGGATLPVVQALSASRSLALIDINKFNVNSTVSNYTATVPAQATVAWTADAEMHFLPSSTGDITITADAGVSLNGVVAGSLTLSTQNGAATLKRTGADAWWIGGVIGTTAEQRAALGLGNISGINRLINGAFSVNQLALSGTVTLAAGDYGHDGWKAGASGCTYTFATTANVTTLTITAGSLQQVVEGVNLQSGTHTLSWVGTAQGKIGAGSYSASGVTGAATGGTNLTVEFNTGTLSLAQLQPGDQALPFENRLVTQELLLCQRYYTTFDTQVAEYTQNGFSASHQFNFSVAMRATPTIALVQGTKTSGFSDSFAVSPTTARVIVRTTNSTGTTVDGFSNAVIKCSARL